MKDNKINIDGKEYEIISYITLDIGNFIVYTDGTELENGKIFLKINRFSHNEHGILFDEVDDSELEKVMNVLKERLINNE